MVVDIQTLRLVPEKKVIRFSSKVVYGPIISKRSFHSIGINFWPNRKVCSFDCRYCHCGKSTLATGDRMEYVEFLKQLEEAFIFHSEFNNFIQDIVIEGNGEPTLYPHFFDVTNKLRLLRDKYFPQIPLVLFTNATNLDKEEVKKGVLLYDQVFFKLDAAEEKIANNVVVNKKNIDQIIEEIGEISRLIKTGKYHLKNFEISTAVVGSKIGNYESLFREKFIKTLKKLGPQKIYLYDIDRVSPGENLDFRIDKSKLYELARYVIKETEIEVIAMYSGKGRGTHELSAINEVEVKEKEKVKASVY